MSEINLNPINSVRPVETGAHPTTPGSVQAEHAKAPKTDPVEPEAALKQAKKEPGLSNDLANISLQFRVDEETQKLTVFIVDRNSKRVLRSIPPGELQKLQAGDLLKLTA